MSNTINTNIEEVFVVKIGNRPAVQDLKKAIDIVNDLAEEFCWSDDIMELKSLLHDVWDGLTFAPTK